MTGLLRSLPNALTVARIVLVGPLAWLLLNGYAMEALVLAFGLGLSDWLDGALARGFNWQSRLGGMLDPIADKLLLLTVYSVLVFLDELPLALLALALIRDAVIVAGAIAWHFLVEEFRAEPTRLSKFNTAAQIGLMWAFLMDMAVPGVVPEMLKSGLIYLVAATLLTTLVQYVAVWGRRTLAHRRAKGVGE